MLLLTAIAVGALLFAVADHQILVREKEGLHASARLLGERESLIAGMRADLEKARTALAQAETQARQAQEQEDVRVKLETLLKGEAERKQEIQALGTTLQQLVQQVQAKLGEMGTAVAEVKGQLTSTGSGLQGRIDEALKLGGENAQLAQQITNLDARLKELEARLKEKDAEVASLKKALEKAQEDLAKAREAGREKPAVRTDPPAIQERPPPPVPVVTSIVAIDEKGGLVIVGAGKKSGIEPGHSLSVSRDGKPLGKLRILRAYEDMAGAEVVETCPGETIRVQDRASTQSDSPLVRDASTLPPLGKAAPPPAPRLPAGGGDGKPD